MPPTKSLWEILMPRSHFQTYSETQKVVFYKVCIYKIFCVLHYYSNICSGGALLSSGHHHAYEYENKITQIENTWVNNITLNTSLYMKVECKCFFGVVRKVFFSQKITGNYSQGCQPGRPQSPCRPWRRKNIGGNGKKLIQPRYWFWINPLEPCPLPQRSKNMWLVFR